MRSIVLPEPHKVSGAAPAYVRYKPEQTLLYQLVEQYWPEFQTQLSETGRFRPRHVTREFEVNLACGRPLPRVGGLTAEEAVGEDGLR